jgi:hypothetical protein
VVEQVQHPEAAEAARLAFEATGCKSHPEFCALTRGAVKLRTFRRWLAGDGPADPMALQYLQLIRSGWRPPA